MLVFWEQRLAFLATPKTRSWIAGAKSAEVRNLVIKGIPQ